MPSRRRGPGVVLLAGLLALLLGCQAVGADQHIADASGLEQQTPLSELDLLDDPRGYSGPSTALLPSTAIAPLAERPAPELPVTVVSHDRSGDREVTVTDSSRVLALSMTGNLAGTVSGLGLIDSLVGRDVSTNFPGTEDLPYVTAAGHSIEIESVLELAPTVVITDGSVGPLDVVLQLRDAGIPLVFVTRDASFEGSYEAARQVGAALGVEEAGIALAERIRGEVEATIAEIAGIVPDDPAERVRMAFLYVRGSAGIYYLFGAESGVDAMVDALGGVDVASEIGWVGMKPMTDEAIIQMDPDLLLVMTDGLESVGGVDGLLETLPAVALTSAGEKRRIVDMADTVILSFGPRSAAVLDALARAIYAPEAAG